MQRGNYKKKAILFVLYEGKNDIGTLNEMLTIKYGLYTMRTH